MQIHGLNKTTLLDYPEHVAATIFTGGCNFCCPFCHNKDLVLNPSAVPLIAEEEVLAFLKKRIGILSGVCITGGAEGFTGIYPKNKGFGISCETGYQRQQAQSIKKSFRRRASGLRGYGCQKQPGEIRDDDWENGWNGRKRG